MAPQDTVLRSQTQSWDHVGPQMHVHVVVNTLPYPLQKIPMWVLLATSAAEAEQNHRHSTRY